mgnify:FL=1
MDTGVKISIIVAVAENGVIGKGDGLPWYLSDDLKRFKKLTLGHTVIVGRKTHESIVKRLGHPLPDRRTIVVTRQKDYRADRYEIAHSLEEALKIAPAGEEVFVIGGAEIYEAFLPLARKIYRTYVMTDAEGDTIFPSGYHFWEWEVSEHLFHPKDEKHEYAFYWDVLVRKEKLKMESFVVLEHARHDDQLSIMKKIQKEGYCPFCSENTIKAVLMPVIKDGKYWHIRENRWPYNNTRVHLLLIHQHHTEELSDLEPGAWQELGELLKWLEEKYKVRGGAFGMRFGDPRTNGATVNHLHVQFIVANIIDRNDPNYQPVRFRVG